MTGSLAGNEMAGAFDENEIPSGKFGYRPAAPWHLTTILGAVKYEHRALH